MYAAPVAVIPGRPGEPAPGKARIDRAAAGLDSARRRGYGGGPTSLRAGALAPDGVIESVEAIDPNWFCVGVQWHPESESASALDMQLFECFIQACLRQAQPLSLAA